MFDDYTFKQMTDVSCSEYKKQLYRPAYPYHGRVSGKKERFCLYTASLSTKMSLKLCILIWFDLIFFDIFYFKNGIVLPIADASRSRALVVVVCHEASWRSEVVGCYWNAAREDDVCRRTLIARVQHKFQRSRAVVHSILSEFNCFVSHTIATSATLMKLQIVNAKYNYKNIFLIKLKFYLLLFIYWFKFFFQFWL